MIFSFLQLVVKYKLFLYEKSISYVHIYEYIKKYRNLKCAILYGILEKWNSEYNGVN